MQLHNLNTKFLGRKVIHYKTIDSTQLEVWRRVERQEIEEGTVILADIQTKGKRNSWQSMAYIRGKQYSIFFWD